MENQPYPTGEKALEYFGCAEKEMWSKSRKRERNERETELKKWLGNYRKRSICVVSEFSSQNDVTKKVAEFRFALIITLEKTS